MSLSSEYHPQSTGQTERHNQTLESVVCCVAAYLLSLAGQKVWLASKDLPLQDGDKKLASRFVSPFDVVRMVNPVVVLIDWED